MHTFRIVFSHILLLLIVTSEPYCMLEKEVKMNHSPKFIFICGRWRWGNFSCDLQNRSKGITASKM